MSRDSGLDYLLDLNGFEVREDNGYWYRFEARKVVATKERPHGIRYSLTLHDNHNQRIFGMDNAHALPKAKSNKKKYAARIVNYDHSHKNQNDMGEPYHFESAAKLVSDFLKQVNKILEET